MHVSLPEQLFGFLEKLGYSLELVLSNAMRFEAGSFRHWLNSFHGPFGPL